MSIEIAQKVDQGYRTEEWLFAVWRLLKWFEKENFDNLAPLCFFKPKTLDPTLFISNELHQLSEEIGIKKIIFQEEKFKSKYPEAYKKLPNIFKNEVIDPQEFHNHIHPNFIQTSKCKKSDIEYKDTLFPIDIEPYFNYCIVQFLDKDNALEDKLISLLFDYLEGFENGEVMKTRDGNFYNTEKQRVKVLTVLHKMVEDYEPPFEIHGLMKEFNDTSFLFLHSLIDLETADFIDIKEIKVIPDKQAKSYLGLNEEDVMTNKPFYKAEITVTDKFLEKKKEIESADKTSEKPKEKIKQGDKAYKLKYNEKRELKVNETVLRTPNKGSENDIAAKYITENSDRKITKWDIQEETGKEFKKSLSHILGDLGFEGELRELFFRNRKTNEAKFVNPVIVEEDDDFDVGKIENILSSL